MLVGLAVAWILAKVRRRVTDPATDTALSFMAPWLAYLPAEALHASGVLAVVIAGVLLGHKAPLHPDGRVPASRADQLDARSSSSWRTPSSC